MKIGTYLMIIMEQVKKKMFIKYFKNFNRIKIKRKDLEYYVVRNERIPELAIYSFESGERFEQIFFFLLKKLIDETMIYQGYIEPKGTHLLEQDSWKEEFSLQIEDIHCYRIIFTKL